MRIYIESRKKKIENIRKAYPEAEIIDVTSKGTLPFLKFSPFYPIGEIPVPFSEGFYAASIEGIWQGLKVFEGQDIDENKFTISNMKGLKRTVRSFGLPKGHRKGVHGTELLDYISARRQIYIPAYNWALDNNLQIELERLKELGLQKDLVLLDYETNDDIDNPLKPLSHASLIKYRLEGRSLL
ncbi:DUF6939 family protein [Hymenobacter volaticus]|uniref:Uncharacterized protein n=1 Tax=Hymenobacter volaticus TaxID=2932254 RepID=A0ABY4G1Q8_9BACT|nr:hypothetical protein [Hymenobacter volaticus]UOQ64509.1 hypothetical protein MUN86_13025 [Hymenobacter volaticus]